MIADKLFMLALSIRQPFAELILRGIKSIEYRSRPTRVIGQRFYIYASKAGARSQQTGNRSEGIWSRELEVPVADSPTLAQMVAIASAMRVFPMDLPTGVIVGSAVIDRVTRDEESAGGLYRWHLTGVERAKRLRKPIGHPQPVWFRPFGEC